MALMDFMLTGGPIGSTQAYFDAAAAGSAGVGLGEQRTAYTVPTDAIRALTPVSEPGAGAQWGGFWQGVQGVLGNVAQIELARYAQKRAIAAPVDQAVSQQAPAAAAAAAAPRVPPLVWIGGGVLAVAAVAFLALRKG